MKQTPTSYSIVAEVENREGAEKKDRRFLKKRARRMHGQPCLRDITRRSSLATGE